MPFKINQEAITPIMKQLQEAVMRRGIQPTWKLGDACLSLAAVMHEKAGKEAFLERAGAWYDEIVAAGEPDAKSKEDYVKAVVDAASPLPPDQALTALAVDLAEAFKPKLPAGVAFVMHVFDSATDLMACVANVDHASKIQIVNRWLDHQLRRN